MNTGLSKSYAIVLAAVFACGLGATEAKAWGTITCAENSLYRVTWANDNVWPIKFFPNAPSGSAGRGYLETGMYNWNAVYGAGDMLTFFSDSYGFCESPDDAGFGVAGWDDGACYNWSPNELGVTRYWTQNCFITKSSVYLNADAVQGIADWATTGIHEFGHYLGGDHEWYELSVMGYAAVPLPALTASDHLLMRFLYGSGNSASPDLYITDLGLVNNVIPDVISYEKKPAPVCSGSCFSLQAGDTVTMEVSYGNAGTQSAANVPIHMRLGPHLIGEWTWSSTGTAQSRSILTATLPASVPPGLYPLEIEINPYGQYGEVNGPTLPNQISFSGFAVTTPPGWTCSGSEYADGFQCNCNCGAADPDCASGLAVVGCDANDICVDASCSASGQCIYNNNTRLCEDGLFCSVLDQCTLGACEAGSPRDCSVEDSVCSVGECSETTDSCERLPLNEAQACDDGFFCTLETSCAGGQCTGGAPRDCSALDGTCTLGVCGEAVDACVAEPANESGACDDGNLCTDNDQCSTGACVGTPRDCSDAAGPCEIAYCDAATGECVVENAADGLACDDGAYCSVMDTCVAGTCTAGPSRDCGAQDGMCTAGVCDEAADVCIAQATNETGACDDGIFCTVETTCAGGACSAGAPRDCTALDSVCTVGVCGEGVGACVAEASNEDGTCDDGNLCTDNDKCSTGACVGTPRDCSDAAGPCEVGYCDAATGACVVENAVDGLACDDGAYCSTMDSCMAGVCVAGPARDCSGQDGACSEGVCDEDADACIAEAVNEAGPCDDGEVCTTGDTCSAGACVGGPPPDCGDLNSTCQVGLCSPGLGCVAFSANEGASCDDDDPCSIISQCRSGACEVTTEVDCEDLTTECSAGVCNAETGECETVARREGSPCDDNGCQLEQVCTAGACSGGSRRRCESDDFCSVGYCDDADGSCRTSPIEDCAEGDGGCTCSGANTKRDGAPWRAMALLLPMYVLTRRRRGRGAPRA